MNEKFQLGLFYLCINVVLKMYYTLLLFTFSFVFFLKICLAHVQVFLTLCALVTIYFADEVPLTVNQPNHLTDSAPLLDDPQRTAISKSKHDMPAAPNANGNKVESGHERDANLKHISKKAEDTNGSFNDGPGAVLVNLLTSLRHLPPAMHVVLIVMALTWVGV